MIAKKLKFLDLFSGIGGFRLGMEQAGHECVGWVEWDKFARRSYEAIHDTEGEWTAHDITSVSDDAIRQFGRERGPIHVICAGFPCQAFSIAGQRKGFEDTRGTLFFEIARFANILRPRYLFLENVKGLLNHDNGDTFETILRTLDELGYDAEWDLLNSKDFGVPQNRERVFIIGHLRGERTRKVFPIKRQINEYSTVGKSTKTAVARTFTAGGNSAGNHSGMTMIKVVEPIPVLTPDREEKRQNGRRFKNPGEPMFTLTAQDKHGVLLKPKHIPGPDDINNSLRIGGRGSISEKHNYDHIYDGFRIRRLTPRECWRLQGFPDWAFDKAAKVNSDSQLYKQAGNSVTVNVIYEIAKRLE